MQDTGYRIADEGCGGVSPFNSHNNSRLYRKTSHRKSFHYFSKHVSFEIKKYMKMKIFILIILFYTKGLLSQTFIIPKEHYYYQVNRTAGRKRLGIWGIK